MYNGWQNYETWLVNLHFEGIYEDLAKDSDCSDKYELANEFQAWTEEMINEEGIQNSFIRDLVNASISEVNWVEIAENYEEFLSVEDED